METKYDELVIKIEDLADYELSVESFDDFLDETQEEYYIGNMGFLASNILKNCDPIAYQMAYREEDDRIKGDMRDEIQEEIEESFEDEEITEEQKEILEKKLKEAF